MVLRRDLKEGGQRRDLKKDLKRDLKKGSKMDKRNHMVQQGGVFGNLKNILGIKQVTATPKAAVKAKAAAVQQSVSERIEEAVKAAKKAADDSAESKATVDSALKTAIVNATTLIIKVNNYYISKLTDKKM
jgi:hypothetical protein